MVRASRPTWPTSDRPDHEPHGGHAGRAGHELEPRHRRTQREEPGQHRPASRSSSPTPAPQGLTRRLRAAAAVRRAVASRHGGRDLPVHARPATRPCASATGRPATTAWSRSTTAARRLPAAARASRRAAGDARPTPTRRPGGGQRAGGHDRRPGDLRAATSCRDRRTTCPRTRASKRTARWDTTATPSTAATRATSATPAPSGKRRVLHASRWRRRRTVVIDSTGTDFGAHARAVGQQPDHGAGGGRRRVQHEHRRTAAPLAINDQWYVLSGNTTNLTPAGRRARSRAPPARTSRTPTGPGPRHARREHAVRDQRRGQLAAAAVDGDYLRRAAARPTPPTT